jgi:hypothetical protein
MQGRETLNMKLVRGNTRNPKMIDGERCAGGGIGLDRGLPHV